MIELIIDNSKINNEKCKYVISTLLNIYGIININKKITISYGNRINDIADINILSKNLELGSEIFSDKVIIEEDIIFKTFELITCKIERDLMKNYKECINNIIKKPFVNYYAEILGSSIEKICCKRNILITRNTSKFTVILSHDVDNITDKNIYVFLNRVLKGLRIMENKQIGQGLKQINWSIKHLFNKNNPYWNFNKYVEMEKKYNFKSSFYFINGDKGRNGARYKLYKVKDIMKELNNLEWEVGLHTNYNSYNNFEKIREEKSNIEEISNISVLGNRNHYLNFDMPNTWKILMENGIKYDSTIGYSTDIGFRAGIASGYYPYDVEKDEVIDILEIPMVIMDSAYMYNMNDMDLLWQKIKCILDETIKIKGTIAINFHNRTLCTEEFLGWKKLYECVLKYIKDNGGSGVTGKRYYDNFIKTKFKDEILIINK